MDHSVQAYLERQSTQLLEALLRAYYGDQKSYGYLIPIIREILAKRKDATK